MGLVSLPESVGQLVALKTLHLSRNQLVSLPESVGQLVGFEDLAPLGESAHLLARELRTARGYARLSYSSSYTYPSTTVVRPPGLFRTHLHVASACRTAISITSSLSRC